MPEAAENVYLRNFLKAWIQERANLALELSLNKQIFFRTILDGHRLQLTADITLSQYNK